MRKLIRIPVVIRKSSTGEKDTTGQNSGGGDLFFLGGEREWEKGEGERGDSFWGQKRKEERKERERDRWTETEKILVPKPFTGSKLGV